jgi:hypothetical protein
VQLQLQDGVQSSMPRMAEKITSHTSETDAEPTTQLTLTWPVFAITSAIRTTSSATARPHDGSPSTPRPLRRQQGCAVAREAGEGDRRATEQPRQLTRDASCHVQAADQVDAAHDADVVGREPLRRHVA